MGETQHIGLANIVACLLSWLAAFILPLPFHVLFSFVPTEERALCRQALYQIEGRLLTYAPESHLSALFWLGKDSVSPFAARRFCEYFETLNEMPKLLATEQK